MSQCFYLEIPNCAVNACQSQALWLTLVERFETKKESIFRIRLQVRLQNVSDRPRSFTSGPYPYLSLVLLAEQVPQQRPHVPGVSPVNLFSSFVNVRSKRIVFSLAGLSSSSPRPESTLV